MTNFIALVEGQRKATLSRRAFKAHATRKRQAADLIDKEIEKLSADQQRIAQELSRLAEEKAGLLADATKQDAKARTAEWTRRGFKAAETKAKQVS